MQNKKEKMIGKFQQKYQFWDGFGKGFGRVWEGLGGIKIRWQKSFNIRGRGARLLIAALGHDLYRGGLGRSWASLGTPLEASCEHLWPSWAYLAKKHRKNQKVSEILVQLGRQNESQNHEKSALKANIF